MSPRAPPSPSAPIGGEEGTLPVSVRNIHMDRMAIDGAQTVLRLVGPDADHLRGVHLSRSAFSGIRNPDSIACTDDLTFRRVLVNGQEVPPLPHP